MPKKMKDDKTTQTTPVPATPETTTPAAPAQTWSPAQYDPRLYANGGDGFSSMPSADQLLNKPLVKCIDGRWTDPTGAEIPNERPFIVLGVVAFVRGYPTEGAPPVDYTVHPLPHPSVLNAQIPRPWRIGLTGKEEPPFAYYKGALLFNKPIGQILLYGNKTDGCMAAIADLQEAVAAHRHTSGGNEVPVVLLSSVTWQTKYGPKVRPAFKLTGEWTAPPSAPQPVGAPLSAPQIAAQPAPAPDPDDTDQGEASQGLGMNPKPLNAGW